MTGDVKYKAVWAYILTPPAPPSKEQQEAAHAGIDLDRPTHPRNVFLCIEGHIGLMNPKP